MQGTTETSAERNGRLARKNGQAREDLKRLLQRAAGVCAGCGDGFSTFQARIAELEKRLGEERFHLAVLGQFKRGKSTLLNALIGEALLPIGVVPLTSIPTFLRSGKTRAIRIGFYDGTHRDYPNLTLEQARAVLARHVTERENPQNRLGVEQVEVEHPSALLGAGVVLIDTPGIGSTFRHNTEAALNFLPQCDAALFLVSADPPITEMERKFLKAARQKVAKLCFVMNKVDYLNETELAEAIAFFEKALQEAGVRGEVEIFPVSAKKALEARIKEDALLWRESGLEKLHHDLLDFLSREKSLTLQAAIAKKARDVLADAAMTVELERRSLALSFEELEKRIGAFDAKAKELEQEKIRAVDLLAGDKKRTVQFLEELAEALRRDAREHFLGLVSEVLEAPADPAAMERGARARIAAQIPEYFGASLGYFCGEVNRAFEQALRPHHDRLDALVRALRSTAAELFEIPYRSTASDSSMEEVHRPYWVTQGWSTLVSPVPEGFFDRFLPNKLRKARLKTRLAREVETLVTRNVENLRWATLRNLDEAFRRFAAHFDERLKETAEATRSAMQAAQLRREQSATAAPVLEHLERHAAELAELQSAISQYAPS